MWPLYPSKRRSRLLWPWRAAGSTVEIVSVPGYLLGDPEPAVVAFLDILTGDEGEQVGRFPGRSGELDTVEDTRRGAGVGDQRVDQRLPGGGVIPVARRFPRRRIRIVAAQHRAHRSRQFRPLMTIERHQQPADPRTQLRHRVLGRHRIEDRRRVHDPARFPITPDSRPTRAVSSKNRFGRSEPRSRVRIPTSTVGWNGAYPVSTPAAACQARSRPR